MSRQLGHKKSREGCSRCKSRKVKCTEERPSCAACLRHSLPCHYPQVNTNHLDTTMSGSSSLEGPAIPYSLNDDLDTLSSENYQRRLLELDLLHYYVTVVAPSFPASEEDSPTMKPPDLKELFIVDTVHLALEFPFLLNTVLAISSLHRTLSQEAIRPAEESKNATPATDSLEVPAKRLTTTAAKVAEYARAHRIYLNMSITQQRKALIELSPQNADAVCVNSTLLAFLAMKILPHKPDLPYEPPLQWLHMAHAIATVIKASKPLLPLDGLWRRILLLNEPDFRDTDVVFNFEHIPPFKAVLSYPENSLPDEGETLTYNLAASYMAGVYRAIENGDSHRQISRRLTSMSACLPKQFVELVEQRRPKALVILAYMMSMTKYVDHYWFFRGTAEHEVYGIQSILPEEWQWAMEWPLAALKTLGELRYRRLEA